MHQYCFTTFSAPFCLPPPKKKKLTGSITTVRIHFVIILKLLFCNPLVKHTDALVEKIIKSNNSVCLEGIKIRAVYHCL